MPLTKEVEARLRDHMETIGESNLHPSDRDVIVLLDAVLRIRGALLDLETQAKAGCPMNLSDHSAMRVVKAIRKALEGEQP
jgi:hypothetical protein